jgi:chromosome segregation ATPase
MVITMIFLMATSILVVRNWQLVAELRESIAAEQIASQMIESTSLVNATLEERLANAEQSNSILRLRLLKKEEESSLAQAAMREQESSIALLELRNSDLETSLQHTRSRLEDANLKIDTATTQFQELSSQVAGLNQQLSQQSFENKQNRTQLDAAREQIEGLSQANTRQQQSISQLKQEKTLLNKEIDAYNQQLLTLKGDYEIVKSKYEELIKPARSAKGKYIAEVYYVKGQAGNVIRYRQPGDEEFSRLSLAEVEKRLAQLKIKYGQELYVKIIIPQESGLTYNEAWEFMRKLLAKYDYYYQD